MKPNGKGLWREDITEEERYEAEKKLNLLFEKYNHIRGKEKE